MSDFKRILLNGGWNLLGNALPLLAAILAVPFLIDRIGLERFGVLSLVWVLLGYFSLLDLGIGRALTKMVAERVDDDRPRELSSLCSTGVAAVSALGLVGAILIAVLASVSSVWLVRVPTLLQDETRSAVILVAVGIPAAVCTAALRGLLEGFQAFRLLNLIRIPSGVALFVAPCIGALFSPRLDVGVALLVLTRILILVAHAFACGRYCALSIGAVHSKWLRSLLAFGGWLTVSNTVGPIIVYVDRFVLGVMLPPAAVAHYSAPFEVVSRLLIVPLAFSGALFPALSRANRDDPLRGAALRHRVLGVVVAAVVPIALLGIAGAKPILNVWLGTEFAEQGAVTMQILFVGFALNAVSQLPFAALHSLGRTRDTAWLHLAELPLYVGVLVMLVNAFGLLGAATAWTLRAFVDCVVLHWLLKRAERIGASTAGQIGDAVLR